MLFVWFSMKLRKDFRFTDITDLLMYILICQYVISRNCKYYMYSRFLALRNKLEIRTRQCIAGFLFLFS